MEHLTIDIKVKTVRISSLDPSKAIDRNLGIFCCASFADGTRARISDRNLSLSSSDNERISLAENVSEIRLLDIRNLALIPSSLARIHS